MMVRLKTFTNAKTKSLKWNISMSKTCYAIQKWFVQFKDKKAKIVTKS